MKTVICKWCFIQGKKAEAVAALTELAKEVEAKEPDTWMYMIHTPGDDPKLHSLPTVSNTGVIFISTFKDEEAFEKHLHGTIFTGWWEKYQNLFVVNDGNLFLTKEWVEFQAGYVRQEMVTK